MEKINDSALDNYLNSYCNFCQSDDVTVTQVLKFECKKCGKTRVVQKKLK